MRSASYLPKCNTEKIDLLLLRREMQNIALGLTDYTDEDIKNLMFRAIDVIDGLRGDQKTYRKIVGFNQNVLNKEVRILTKQSLEMNKSAVDEKIEALQNMIDSFLRG